LSKKQRIIITRNFQNRSVSAKLANIKLGFDEKRLKLKVNADENAWNSCNLAI